MASVLVCGGGNAAQVCCCLFGCRYKVTAMSLYGDEAERWERAVRENGGMECTLAPQKKTIRAMPDRITNDPSAVRDCDVVLFTVPSSFHEQYFTALAPHVRDGTIFAVMPARSGCDFLFRKVMGPRAKRLGLVAFETLPWATCRFKEWGKTSTVLGTKETIGAAVVPPEGVSRTQVVLKLQGLLGVEPMIVECPNVMSISLGNPGQVVHPGIMYSRWHAWDGQPLPSRPLFYHGADEQCATVLTGISDDIQAICKSLQSAGGRHGAIDTSQVKTIFEWYLASYSSSCKDASTLLKAMATNSAYDGLCHPMRSVGTDGFVPDFHFRYLTEDVPTGLCFSKGVGDLLGVPTPTIDKVLAWSQEKLGRRFLGADGRMTGPDVGDTRAPQAYGVDTRDKLLEFLGITPAWWRPSGPAAASVLLAAAVAAAALAAAGAARRMSR